MKSISKKVHIDIDYMKDNLTDFMVHSIALCNSSHYDVNDSTITITTWVEDIVGNTDNWYLVFPNVALIDNLKNKKATLIKLSHGCTVSWDASKLRHASSKVSYKRRGSSAGNCETKKK